MEKILVPNLGLLYLHSERFEKFIIDEKCYTLLLMFLIVINVFDFFFSRQIKWLSIGTCMNLYCVQSSIATRYGGYADLLLCHRLLFKISTQPLTAMSPASLQDFNTASYFYATSFSSRLQHNLLLLYYRHSGSR